MIECLNCKMQIDAKTSRRKFCSDKCKMQYFRKHGKKDVATKFDMQVLLNEFMAAIEKLNLPAKEPLPGMVAPILNAPKPIKIRRSYDWYTQARKDCETVEQWNELKEMILSDEFLTERQKFTLTQKPVS